MNKPFNVPVEDLERAVTYPTEAFLSRDYLEAEKHLLWPHVWQMAERIEDIPDVGDWFTYNVADDSIIILRVAPGDGAEALRAFHNVCPHRGRQLVNTPDGVHSVRGKGRRNFVCGFHGWTYDTSGANSYILDPQDWGGALNPECTSLTPVKLGVWGGWIFVNMDLAAEPLEAFLGDAGRILSHFALDKMRYKWRKWTVYPCNWKTGLEAFMEPYHVAGTHTQLLAYGDYYAYSKAYGMHGVSGFDQRNPEFQMSQSSSVTRAGKGDDPRRSTYELIRENYETLANAASTETLVNAASRLVDELPEGTPASEIIAHWMASARRDDAARGVIWPEIPPEIMAEAGLAWHVFPNMSVLHGITFALCYRARPFGDDPDQCIFESYAIERYPEGEEPVTEWEQSEPTAENWGSVLAQDFSNMQWVQKGMKSHGFRGPLPNPHQERKITNFHRNLANFMGRGAVSLLDPAKR
ncbi:MAG: aromatic ring-hydroxylating dioxygenase subunit alpha [Sphingomonadales bacterium]|nr:aromatic ring-hydroxylating dioxygenase subunit alpha [Sphingomonadales bacterium]